MAEDRLTCPVCGVPTVPGARFCHNCGAPLDRPEDTPDAAERRVVTILFGDLSDFTAWAEDLDPERVGVVTDRVLAALATAVEDVGGHVDKLTGDGIMAVFGAPTAHEDDPERAVHAAAQMQAVVQRLMEQETGGGRSMGLRVGLNTGEVLAGIQARLAYTVVGDAVNTAARLADAARIGSVYAGRETALATMAKVSWRALSPLRLKGKREPVPAFELVGIRPSGAPAGLGVGEEAPLIGREAELGRLIGRLLEVVDEDRPGSVLVTGDAGVGKTRLAAELGRFAGELPAARVLWGRAVPYGEARTLAPLVHWVRTAAGIGEGDDAAQALQALQRAVARLALPGRRGPAPAAVVDRLAWLLGIGEGRPAAPRESASPRGLADGGADPLVAAVATLLDGFAAEGPLVLVADDLHWAGEGLLATLAAVAGSLGGPVLLVFVGRSDMLTVGRDGHEWWRAVPDPELLPVAPLDDPSADRLLRAYLGGADLEPSVRDALLARSQGNPFFLGELLHLLVERGLLRRAGNAWQLVGRLPADVLPAGVQAVLAARIDTLDPLARTVLRDAAVVGATFPLAVLRALHPGDPDEVADAVVRLVARGIVTEVGDGGFSFVHALARDVAYAAVPKADRARRHAEVAAWAMPAMPGPRGEVDAFVAGHAEQALQLAEEMALPPDDPAWRARAMAWQSLARMGRAAVARDDNVRGDELLTRALDIAADELPGDERLSLLVARADARASLHRLDEAEQDVAPALSAPSPVTRAAAHLVLGELRRRRGDDDGATTALVSALATASDAGADHLTAEALRKLGLLEYVTGRLASAEARFRSALELAERVHDERGQAWALQHIAWSATTRGDYEAATATLTRAADLFAGLDDSGGLAWCAGTEAFVRLLQGRIGEARELAQGLLPLGEALGERWGVAACLTIDALGAVEQGFVRDGLRQARSALATFTELGDTWGRAGALIVEGVAHRGAGRPKDGLRTLERALRVSREGGNTVTEVLAVCAAGFCHLDRGDVDEAAEVADRALTLLDHLEALAPARLGASVLLALARRGQGRLEEALDLLTSVAASATAPQESTLFLPLRQALAYRADVLLDLGRAAEALAAATEAMRLPAEDVRSRAVALRVLARCYAAAGDEPAAAYALRQARGLLRDTGMAGELAGLDEVRSRLKVRG